MKARSKSFSWFEKWSEQPGRAAFWQYHRPISLIACSRSEQEEGLEGSPRLGFTKKKEEIR